MVIDLLVFQRRVDGQNPGRSGMDRSRLGCALRRRDERRQGETDSPASAGIRVNRYFAEHPEMVLGEHAMRRGIYGPGMTYTCRGHAGRRGE